MKTIATICARGGSVGLPNKNILDFACKNNERTHKHCPGQI
jgi:CMP-N-acetylneuraminic acid synthetase